jgi:peroxiredoxin
VAELIIAGFPVERPRCLHDNSIMAVQSTMLALGTRLPEFALPDVSVGRAVRSSDFREKRALLVVFLCVHCPYVVHVLPELVKIANDYAPKGVGVVGISSNDVEQYPEDAPVYLAAMGRKVGIKFPLLYDQTQQVAKAFSAACTPDFFLFDSEMRLAYRGQLDDSRPSRGADRPGSGTLNGLDLRGAIDAILAGWPPNPVQRPSIGCNIKWKPGNAPDYFTL